MRLAAGLACIGRVSPRAHTIAHATAHTGTCSFSYNTDRQTASQSTKTKTHTDGISQERHTRTNTCTHMSAHTHLNTVAYTHTHTHSPSTPISTSPPPLNHRYKDLRLLMGCLLLCASKRLFVRGERHILAPQTYCRTYTLSQRERKKDTHTPTSPKSPAAAA